MNKERFSGLVFTADEHEAAQMQNVATLINGRPLALVRFDRIEAALTCLQNTAFDVIFLDIEGAEDHGGLIARTRTVSPYTPIVVLTTCDDDELALKLLQHGAHDYLTKGHTTADLLWRVTRYAMERQRQLQLLGQRNRELEQEITERRHTEAAEHRAKEAAEAANQAKNQFLAVVSHEIRTPMNAIVGMTELALGTELTTVQHEYLTIVKNSARSLLSVIGDILDFSKIEAGKLLLEKEAFSLPQLVDESLQTLSIKAQEKSLQLTWQAEAGFPDSVYGDPGRLRQVLLNLMGNAIKFTHQGQVLVRLACQQTLSGGLVAQISVSDTGIGIPDNQLKAVFEAFTQVDSSSTRRYSGTGLGLSIAAQLVQLMGGRIWVESTEGKGSTFHFSTPLELAEETPPNQPLAMDPANLHILLVEDDELNQRVVTGILGHRGCRVSIADNGVAALERLSHEDFDLVLMDLHMPQMDGVETTRQIRRREDNTGDHIPIMGLTAFASTMERDRCISSGMDACLNKPLDPDKLFALMGMTTTDAAATKPELDIPTLRHRFGGDPRLFEDIRDIFFTRYPNLVRTIDTALGAENDALVKETAHILKGMLSHFGDHEIIAVANEVEKRGSKAQFAAGRRSFRRLKAQIGLLVDTLKRFDPKRIAPE